VSVHSHRAVAILSQPGTIGVRCGLRRGVAARRGDGFLCSVLASALGRASGRVCQGSWGGVKARAARVPGRGRRGTPAASSGCSWRSGNSLNCKSPAPQKPHKSAASGGVPTGNPRTWRHSTARPGTTA